MGVGRKTNWADIGRWKGSWRVSVPYIFSPNLYEVVKKMSDVEERILKLVLITIVPFLKLWRVWYLDH